MLLPSTVKLSVCHFIVFIFQFIAIIIFINFYYQAQKKNILSVAFESNWSRTMENIPTNAIETSKGYWRRIETIIMHRNYANESMHWLGYDIALIKLEIENGTDVPVGKMLPACLPGKAFDDQSNEILFAAGYGWRRYPHCITDMLGPEKFQTCGRELQCTTNHRTTYCPLNFTDTQGTIYLESLKYSSLLGKQFFPS